MPTLRQLETGLIADPEAMFSFIQGRVDREGNVPLVGIGRSINVIDYEHEGYGLVPDPGTEPSDQHTIPLDRDFTAITYRGPDTNMLASVDDRGITTITINNSYTILKGLRFPRSAIESDPTLAAYKKYYTRMHESLIRPRTIEFKPEQFAGGKTLLLGRLRLY